MTGLNPCDVCEKDYCGDCALYPQSAEWECCNYNCFLNHEGDCIISIFARCGAWRKDSDDT